MVRIIQFFLHRSRNLAMIMLLLLLCLRANGQYYPEHDFLIKNTAYLEIGGNGLWYSFCFDRVIKQYKSSAFTGRIGFSYLGNFSNANTVTIPLTVSFLFGRNANFLELGGGPTFLHAFSESISGIAALGIIGFRHQPMESTGTMYRVAFNPFFGEYSSDKGYVNWVGAPWASVSVGYIF